MQLSPNVIHEAARAVVRMVDIPVPGHVRVSIAPVNGSLEEKVWELCVLKARCDYQRMDDVEADPVPRRMIR
jgi:hypothetical protein